MNRHKIAAQQNRYAIALFALHHSEFNELLEKGLIPLCFIGHLTSFIRRKPLLLPRAQRLMITLLLYPRKLFY
jgi:hypothetical protein